MATSSAYIKGIGEVKIFRRRGLKNIRLRVDNDGVIKLSLPWYVTKRMGLAFVLSKHSWLKDQLKPHPTSSSEINSIGKYQLSVKESNLKRTSYELADHQIIIYVPKNISEERIYSQSVKTLEQILKKQTEKEIVPKLKELANDNNIYIRSIKVRKLKSRWGSCDHAKNITLNLYLSQLPMEIIDYILCHELAHTKHLNHSKDFWRLVKTMVPDYIKRKRELSRFSPGMLNVR